MKSRRYELWQTLLLTIFSGSMSFIVIICAFGLVIFGVLTKPELWTNANINPSISQQIFLGISLLMIGILLCPMFYFNVRHLLGKPNYPSKINRSSTWEFLLLVILWVLIIFMGDRLFKYNDPWIWLVKTPIYLTAVGLPIYIFLQLGLGGIALGSKKRSWSIFGLGLVLGPILIIISELIITALALIGGIILISITANINQGSLSFLEKISRMNSLEETQQLINPYLMNPWIISIVLFFVSVIIPIIEEFLKPAGTWLAVNKKLQPIDGFSIGILSGAGYALFETLLVASSMGEGWGMLLIGRAGTDLMHIFNTGLLGWAMVSAWNLKGSLKLLGIYLITILVHGIWNGLGVTISFSSILLGSRENNTWISQIGIAGKLGLFIISIGMFILLITLNRKFTKGPKEQFQSEV